MAELLVVANPRKRKRRKGSRKGRMPAGLRRYWAARRAGKTHTKRRRRRSATRVHHRRRRRGARAFPSGARAARGYVVGPRRIRRRKLNPHRKHHFRRRRHSNPRGFGFGGLTRQVMPTVRAGAWGASGALMLDALHGLVFPRLAAFAPMLTNPYLTYAVKAVGAVVVGTVGGRLPFFRGKHTVLAHGAMTVVTHDFLKTLLQQMAPALFAAGGTVSLGNLSSYLSGSAPIVGTATFPKTYMPWGDRLGDYGSYLSGPSGAVDDSPGVYAADAYGFDPWAGGSLDANTPWY